MAKKDAALAIQRHKFTVTHTRCPRDVNFIPRIPVSARVCPSERDSGTRSYYHIHRCGSIESTHADSFPVRASALRRAPSSRCIWSDPVASISCEREQQQQPAIPSNPQPPAASGSTGDRNRVEFILMNNAQTHTRTERVYRHLNPARHRPAHRRYRNMMRGR